MTKEELDKEMAKMPDSDIVDMGEAGVWRKNNMTTPMHWWHKVEADNLLEILPDAAKGKDNTLSRDYDNAAFANLGVTPTLEDFKRLFNTCERIVMEDTSDLALKKGKNYLYFHKGRYWMSNFKRDESCRHGVLPYSVIIDASFNPNVFDDEDRLTEHTCDSNKGVIRPIVKQDSNKE